MVLVAMQELGKGLKSGVYTLAHETSIKSYQISVGREEYIRTALGYLRTLRVSHRREDGKREIIFWFAPRFDYLLVQAVQRRKNGLRFEFARLAIKETSHTR